jgi:hypothetical protein
MKDFPNEIAAIRDSLKSSINQTNQEIAKSNDCMNSAMCNVEKESIGLSDSLAELNIVKDNQNQLLDYVVKLKSENIELKNKLVDISDENKPIIDTLTSASNKFWKTKSLILFSSTEMTKKTELETEFQSLHEELSQKNAKLQKMSKEVRAAERNVECVKQMLKMPMETYNEVGALTGKLKLAEDELEETKYLLQEHLKSEKCNLELISDISFEFVSCKEQLRAISQELIGAKDVLESFTSLLHQLETENASENSSVINRIKGILSDFKLSNIQGNNLALKDVTASQVSIKENVASSSDCATATAVNQTKLLEKITRENDDIASTSELLQCCLVNLESNKNFQDSFMSELSTEALCYQDMFMEFKSKYMEELAQLKSALVQSSSELIDTRNQVENTRACTDFISKNQNSIFKSVHNIALQ